MNIWEFLYLWVHYCFLLRYNTDMKKNQFPVTRKQFSVNFYKLFFSLFFLIITFLIFSPHLQAQETELIRNQETHQSEIADLTASYKSYLAQYRNLEGQYQVSVSQYYQVQTLASLEKAVQDVRQTMLIRNQVIDTYLKILRLTLTDTHGVNIDDKNVAINNLSATEKSLENFQSSLENSQDRVNLQLRIEEFTGMEEQIESVSYHALGLIAFGRLQTSYDQTVSLLSLVNERVEERNSGVLLSEKQRAIDEIRQKLLTTKALLDENYQDGLIKENNEYSSSSYNRLLEDLDDVYVNMLQIHGYIEEVLQ